MSRQVREAKEGKGEAARALTGAMGVAVLAAAVAAAACGSGAPEPPAQQLDSRVRGADISVDGLRRDWEGNLTRVGGRDVFAGFHRTDDALYMAIVSQDPSFDARVFRSGLTVWFDTAATRRRVHGVRYPVFGAEARQKLRADTTGGRPDRQRLLRAAGSDLVLVTDGSTEERVSPGQAAGLDAAASVDRGLFTWEARIPLRAGDSGDGAEHALPAARVDNISVGLQAGGDQGELMSEPSGEPRDTAVADSLPADSMAADSAGARGGRRTRPPAASPGASREIPVLEIWTRVNLGAPGGG